MKRHTFFTFAIMLLAALAIACSTHEEEPDDKSDKSDSYSGWADEIVPDDPPQGYMTVAEAIEAPIGELINVRGYIIGSTSRTIYNSIMAPPFESRSSLILADRIFRPGDTPDEYDPFYEDELFPVSLNDFADYKRELNLVDNPQHWHRIIYIYGMKTKYLGMPGMNKIMKYEFEDEIQ